MLVLRLHALLVHAHLLSSKVHIMYINYISQEWSLVQLCALIFFNYFFYKFTGKIGYA